MSPVSRGRKGKKNKKKPSQSAVANPFGAPDQCDCPACSDADLDPQSLADQMVGAGADLLAAEDPLEAELVGAAFVSVGAAAGPAFEDAMVRGLIPEFEARATGEALALLLAIGSVAESAVSETASAAHDRLVAAGVPRPAWAAELSEPTTVGDCHRLADPAGTGSMLACSFHRAGRSYAVMVCVDHLDCGAASEIMLLDAGDLPEALRMVTDDVDANGISSELLDAAEFRWQLENALNARAVHDAEDLELGLDDLPNEEDEDEEGPGYRALAALLRVRMSALPLSDKPPVEHPDVENSSVGPVVDEAALPALPAKRTESVGAAPIYQLKVGLRGAKPPIWRRIEVPADTSLARLHLIIQIAFGWDDSHLHAYRTPYGDFGVADAEVGLFEEATVTLEQVAPGARSAISYVYDFGDDWEHSILVEKVLDQDGNVAYPRCVGGRRAAPPEDCGGIWGYTDLLEILAEPTHPEHEDRLEWLGLDKGSDFDPASFDAAATTRALSNLD
ncbi:MAG TPA: plasmid pRiA4b ORF-3 family protein [Pseudonocardiaceae bacterium]|jgi:hypothetical protein|nr:plasmid pRiA4b ORF-3 family protein [Pseudonocardiaceae bacterium]